MKKTALTSGLVLCAALVSLATWSTAASARDRTSSVTGPNKRPTTAVPLQAMRDMLRPPQRPE